MRLNFDWIKLGLEEQLKEFLQVEIIREAPPIGKKWGEGDLQGIKNWQTKLWISSRIILYTYFL